MVVLVNTDAIAHVQRLVLGEDRRTAIAFLLGIVPVRCITLELQVQLSCLHLRFLQTEEISIQCLECLTEVSLSFTGSQPVYVPTDEFHATKLRKNESNAKEKLVFLFIAECIVTSAKPELLFILAIKVGVLVKLR